MKKVRTIVATLLGILFPVSAWAQGWVRGVVVDSVNSPVAGASVRLYQEHDTSSRKGGTTNRNGQFELEKIADGKYILNISFLGYEDYSTEIAVAGNTGVGLIILKERPLDLGAVENQWG